MVYIGQRAAHLITGYVVRVYLFLYCGWSHRLGSVVVCLSVAFYPPAPSSTHCSLCPCTLCPPRTHASLAPSSLGVQRGGRVKEALGMEAGKAAGPLSGAGMQKMWKQLGSESWGFQSPEVTKGFHPGSVGRGGRWWAADSDGRL